MVSESIQTFVNKGATLRYKIEGSGPPIVVIGSCQYSSRTFSSNLYQHAQFIFVDHRGFSESVEPNEPTSFEISLILDDVHALCESLHLKNIIVLGHSIHALMAVEYVSKYPENVKALSLIAASPIVGEELHHKANQYFQESVSPIRKTMMSENLGKLQGEIAENPEKAFVNRMLRFAPMLWYNPEFNASPLWENVYVNPIGGHIVWGPMFEGYNLNDLSKQITVPTFLALGRYDYFNPPYLWETVRGKFKSLTLRVFERSGHTPQYEEPETFKTEFLEWLMQKI